MISPHGGKLTHKIVSRRDKRKELESPRLIVGSDLLQDAKNIAVGAYSPVEGFLRQDDFNSVLERMRLVSNIVWSIPIVLDLSEAARGQLKGAKSVILTDSNNISKAILKNIEIYPFDKKKFAKNIFGTLSKKHPGVEAILKKGKYLIGGDLSYFKDKQADFSEFYYSPAETRKIFHKKKWKTIAAFQTRNVPHRSHEYLQKLVLKEVDGLFVQPVMGAKKPGDFKDDVIIETYKILLDKYYPSGRHLLGILPMRMHYAGPREAVMHALVRKNYGCTHMIIGRDHAGVGNYYRPYAAHEIFDNFKKEEIGIKILKYENASHCNICGGQTICNHPENQKIMLSGTKLREMIKNKNPLPVEFTRPEISDLLLKHPNPFV